MSDVPTLDAARLRATTARTELHAALDDALGWLSPDRLKAEAALAANQQIGEAKKALRRSATRHPLATWSAVAGLAALLAWLLRRPAITLTRATIDAARALRNRFVRRKQT
ncbi:hypothetical protein LWE61_14645 [Sphingobium sufflavum]|uniref:hypothetical protein n=1 Tax=Sphingobium sufflavum TaxID=1129547 RepID=UPI001F198DE8|nr:hypothetical protein [Sphingobium sufflavum]MCE7797787.1 hypothetical protein [Sphingobium sufflavum]